MSKYSKILTEEGYFRDKYQENKEARQTASRFRAREKRSLEIERICKEWDNDLNKYLRRKLSNI